MTKSLLYRICLDYFLNISKIFCVYFTAILWPLQNFLKDCMLDFHWSACSMINLSTKWIVPTPFYNVAAKLNESRIVFLVSHGVSKKKIVQNIVKYHIMARRMQKYISSFWSFADENKRGLIKYCALSGRHFNHHRIA